MKVLAIISCLALAGCTSVGPLRPGAADWKRVVTPADMQRLRDWRGAFVKALSEARASGNGEAVLREGPLLEPDATLDTVSLEAGDYRCRVIKLGSASPGSLAYVSYPAFGCRVTREGTIARFSKLGGSQRPTGSLFDDGPARTIFLGTLMLGDETRPFDYGTDQSRDMAGAVQRIGERRWRIILPYPHFESLMDVIELVPAEQGSRVG